MIDFKQYVTEGGGRSDLSLLFADRKAFDAAIQNISEPFRNASINKVVALDALGFLFGSLVAKELGVGLVLFRKEGNIPVEKKIVKFNDYSKSEKVFEVASDAIKASDNVLIVDEWSETGSQIKAAISLVEQCGGVVKGVSCFNIDKSVLEDKVLSKYQLHSVL